MAPVDALARRRWARALLLVAVAGSSAVVVRWSGLADLLHLDGLRRLAASAFAEGDDSWHMLASLGAAAILLVALSLVPAWIGRRSRVAAALELRRP